MYYSTTLMLTYRAKKAKVMLLLQRYYCWTQRTALLAFAQNCTIPTTVGGGCHRFLELFLKTLLQDLCFTGKKHLTQNK